MINMSGAWHNPNHAAQGFDIVFTGENEGGLIWFNHSQGKRIHLNGDFVLGEWSELEQTTGGSLFIDIPLSVDDTETVSEEVGFFKLEETPTGLLFTFDIHPDDLPEYGYDGIDLVPLFLGKVSLWRRPGNDFQGIFMIEKDGVTAGHYYGNTADGQDWLVFDGSQSAYRATGAPFRYDSTEPERVATLTITSDEMIWDWVAGTVERYVIERFYQTR